MSKHSCFSHHNACDCREAIYAEMLEALKLIAFIAPGYGQIPDYAEYELKEYRSAMKAVHKAITAAEGET